MSDHLTFTFDGETLCADPGQSLAASITASGARVFRNTGKGSPRGLFCGMGVCQDCLVTVDGVPNQRACMTSVRDGAQVRTQHGAPVLQDIAKNIGADAGLPAPRELEPDVLILGAGAGGLNAAIAASKTGAKVLVLDERSVPGGQYFKQPTNGVSLLDTQQSDGAQLLARARASGAEILSGVETWGAFAGPLLYAVSADGVPLVLRPQKLIVATGAYERPKMVPGWTLPGVMTTGAAQTLWRSYRTLPGKRVAVVGSGPLNLQVALELARGGVDVRLVAESADAPLRNPLAALALFSAGPKLTLAGVSMLLSLRRHGVAVRYRCELVSVHTTSDGALRATFTRDGIEEDTEVDALCMNAGFEPQNEILRLLGSAMRYDPVFGQLRCVRTETMETSVAGVYAIGDCCGLGGAPAAEAEGRIAGAAAAVACGFSATGADAAPANRLLQKARNFQTKLWALHDAAPAPLDTLDDATIVCRCEEITVGQLRESVGDNSAADLATIKRKTRVGMGCCQGRYCGPIAARLVAAKTGQCLEDTSYFAPRVPVKPVSVEVILATQEAVSTTRKGADGDA